MTTRLRDREYDAATVLNNLPPDSNPVAVAEKAAGLARRRRIGSVAVILTGTALVVTIWIAAQTTFIPMMNDADAAHASALQTETIELRCLSPQQAADIINPYVRARGSAYYIPSSGIAAVTVRGTQREIAKSKQLIAQFEEDPNAACRAPAVGKGTASGPVIAPAVTIKTTPAVTIKTEPIISH